MLSYRTKVCPNETCRILEMSFRAAATSGTLRKLAAQYFIILLSTPSTHGLLHFACRIRSIICSLLSTLQKFQIYIANKCQNFATWMQK